MKKVIALAGSNSKNSINKKLASYAAHKLKEASVKVLDLNDYDLPLYGIDYELEHGIPNAAQQLLDEIITADGIVISLAEHNGAYSAAFKNAFDWMSRINNKLWNNTPMLLMATSPGGRGGKTVLEVAKTSFPHLGGNIVADFSLPSFGQNFSEDRLTDQELNSELEAAIEQLRKSI
jgi:NAD(P)H-dependent FMN reductase